MGIFKLTSVRIVALFVLSLAAASLITAWLNPSPVAVVAMDTRKQPGDELLALIFDHARNGETEAVKMYLERPSTIATWSRCCRRHRRRSEVAMRPDTWARPIAIHQRRMLATAKVAVSWSRPTVTQPRFFPTA